MYKQDYITYYESTIYDDEEARLAVIAALHEGDIDCLWYPEPIPESFLFSTSNRLYAGELPCGTRILLIK